MRPVTNDGNAVVPRTIRLPAMLGEADLQARVRTLKIIKPFGNELRWRRRNLHYARSVKFPRIAIQVAKCAVRNRHPTFHIDRRKSGVKSCSYSAFLKVFSGKLVFQLFRASALGTIEPRPIVISVRPSLRRREVSAREVCGFKARPQKPSISCFGA